MAKKKEWKEGEIALTFGLQSIEIYLLPFLTNNGRKINATDNLLFR